MTVIMADQDQSGLDRTVEELGSTRLVPRVMDVSSSEDWQALSDEAWDTHGGVGLLCNNAGIGVTVIQESAPVRMWELPVDKFRRVVEVNLMGTFLGMKHVLPRMIADAGRGHIVNTASMAGFLAPPYLGPYSASKFAVVALSEVAAAELAPYGIGVTILCPGGVATAFNVAARQRGSAKMVDEATFLPHEPGAADVMKMTPDAVAARVIQAVANNELFVFTHPEYEPLVRERQAAVLRSFGDSAQLDYSDPPDLLNRSRTPLHRLDQ